MTLNPIGDIATPAIERRPGITWGTTADWDGSTSESGVSHSADVVRLADFLETGTVDLSGSLPGDGVEGSISFVNEYVDPVVIPYVITYNGSQAVCAKARNVTSTGCNVFMVEDADDGHAAETLGYIVVEKGVHSLGGSTIEAGSVSTSTCHTTGDTVGKGESITFSGSFSSKPAVLHGLQTHNNGDFMETAAHSPSSSGVTILQMRGGAGTPIATETIGWVAVSEGANTSKGTTWEGNYQPTDGSNDGVEDTPQTINFHSSFSTAPDVVVKGMGIEGQDGFWARGTGTLTSSYHDTYAEEDQVADTEQAHADEPFGAFAAEPGTTLTSTAGSITSATKSYSTAQTPDLTDLSYSLNGGSIDLTVTGSPGTASEEVVTQSLDGSNGYQLTWANSHTDFKVTVDLTMGTTVGDVPTFDSMTLQKVA